ncbi:Glucose / Sorbosone dehydrogenase [freshwater metagenome]|uniref:Glucose / Sorbosone dehydrogenase n=1 Tax=freshwater metagenome TaxID=449393 RepID=A0A094Q537_9ZZZZ
MKVKVLSQRPLIIALISIALTIPSLHPAQSAVPGLTVTAIDTPQVKVLAPNGERGAALAVMADGRLLLGGGGNGSSLFIYDPVKKSTTLAGRAIKATERLNDSRFAITDIGILAESATKADLLISFPTYNRAKDCVSVHLYRYTLNLASKISLTRGKLWFKSNPCVPVSAVQHAAGRLAVIDKKSAYLTIGDLGYTEIDDVNRRGDLGSVFKVSATTREKISTGHRNQQGILLIGKDLYTSEHGPRGGDELNIIENGVDYGWPAVTYGEPYSSGDYVRPKETGSHDGYRKPLTYWVPSVAPTELVQLSGSLWGTWAGQIVMGTLREESLIFIELLDAKRVGKRTIHPVNERIRDLEIGTEGEMIATTDSGKLLFISIG